MIDLLHLEDYRENNRIEAKKALGGLPKSLWETYSAFANTLGGIILLGVVEQRNKRLKAIDLPDPACLLREFWRIINNPRLVSSNILSDKNVTIADVEGKKIIVIEVPRAQRYEKPVYLDGDPLGGTYRRTGEGDYRCTREEVRAMLRDATMRTADMAILDQLDLAVFNYETVMRYRLKMEQLRPGHVWEDLDDDEFLYKIGAIGRSVDETAHPTVAGLLVFGHGEAIKRQFPNFNLSYQEYAQDSSEVAYRLDSQNGDWSGNIYDFFTLVYNRLIRDIKLPGDLPEELAKSETPIHKALGEALANCLINADYYGEQGVEVVYHENLITFANPGEFRISPAEAKSGGISDPRNSAIIKIFNLIEVAQRAGGGIPSIYAAWRQQGWELPNIVEQFDPPRITFSLAIKKCSLNPFARRALLSDEQAREMIIASLTTEDSLEMSEIVRLLGISGRRTRQILKAMEEEGIIYFDYGFLTRYYRLKA